jgi:hypothetical protein
MAIGNVHARAVNAAMPPCRHGHSCGGGGGGVRPYYDPTAGTLTKLHGNGDDTPVLGSSDEVFRDKSTRVDHRRPT